MLAASGKYSTQGRTSLSLTRKRSSLRPSDSAVNLPPRRHPGRISRDQQDTEQPVFIDFSQRGMSPMRPFQPRKTIPLAEPLSSESDCEVGDELVDVKARPSL